MNNPYTGYATTNSTVKMPVLTFDALLESHEKIANAPPVVTAFYFIDRAKEHFEFLSLLKNIPVASKSSGIFRPETLPVFNVRADEITDDWPPIKEPGVWAVMSDGSHQEMMRGKTVGEWVE